MEPHTKIPTHVAVIMDGNGRWAERRGLPRMEGHRRGAETARLFVKEAARLGIQTVTLYAFSSENWGRAMEEVQGVMGLLRYYLGHSLKEFKSQGARLKVIGDRSKLDKDLQALIEDAEAETAENTKITVALAISYGGRQSIVKAARAFASEVAHGQHMPRDLTEDMFANYLETADLPPLDLLIRPSGEQRISNFLLWEAAYAEFVFLDVLWPDFDTSHLQDAITQYGRRQRRFGLA